MEILIMFLQMHPEYLAGIIFITFLVILFWKEDEELDNKTWTPFD